MRYPLIAMTLLVAGWLSGCATAPVVLEAVGPASPSPQTGDGQGRLVVHSAREQSANGEVTYIRYTNYRILKEDGSLLQGVVNNTAGHDEKPETISLPSGVYSVVARAEGVGMITIPILIQPLKTTEIHLDGGWKPELRDHSNTDLVRLPTGQIVGWRAPIKNSEPLDEARAAQSDAIVKARLVAPPDVIGNEMAYALIEVVAVRRNTTDHPIKGRFTVGFHDPKNGIAPGESVLYLKLGKRPDGGFEWLLVGG